jgi:hypothetical protein
VPINTLYKKNLFRSTKLPLRVTQLNDPWMTGDICLCAAAGEKRSFGPLLIVTPGRLSLEERDQNILSSWANDASEMPPKRYTWTRIKAHSSSASLLLQSTQNSAQKHLSIRIRNINKQAHRKYKNSQNFSSLCLLARQKKHQSYVCLLTSIQHV